MRAVMTYGATDIVTERGDAGVAAVRAVNTGDLDLEVPLAEAAEAYRAMDERRAIKSLLHF